MRQLTLRVDDALAERLKDAASERRQSVNTFAQSVLSAAVDPQFADGESARVRERLARAGILAATGGTPSTR
nr:transcriptional regulator [Thermoleophilaceae bacterium]